MTYLQQTNAWNISGIVNFNVLICHLGKGVTKESDAGSLNQCLLLSIKNLFKIETLSDPSDKMYIQKEFMKSTFSICQ
jgi:hypothetical protein